MARIKCNINCLKIVEKYYLDLNIFGEQIFLVVIMLVFLTKVTLSIIFLFFISFRNVWDPDVNGPKGRNSFY